ncbi:UDP-N-acetylmuramate--L-alanine ligase [Candidatus Peregrinibacteria bacterium]|nr:UDP-N-acetylmuramate--L-alanine ligase [Candidatus Peregrinibacteria bacterium]
MSLLAKKYFHFIGIGGIGTSSLAQILHAKGKIISGSDNCASELTENLKRNGIKAYPGHNAKNVTRKHQIVIYSPAIPANNPELQQAKKLKIPCLSYPEALGELSKEYFTTAIAGTHGKSTTTAMTSLILTAGKLDPTVVIGTKLREFKNKNFRVGKSKYLIIEACEYRRSFLHFQPKILVITNIEVEHLDYYKDLEDYQKAFNELATRVPKDGYIIVHGLEKNLAPILKNCSAKIIKWKKTDLKIKPGIPGQFNVNNATNAAQVGQILGIGKSTIEKAIRQYKGSWRRLEYKKKKLGKTQFIDDYGHHPTEVRVTLAAIREQHPDTKILCVFQPHQYSRTKLLLKEFAYAFNAVDQVIIPNIYKVRDSDEDVKSMNVDMLLSEIKKHQPHAKNGKSLEKTAEFIKKNHQKFDIIVTMGAGDISKIYKTL